MTDNKQLSEETKAVASLMAEMEAKIAQLEQRLAQAEKGQGKQPIEDNRPMTRDDTPEPGGAWLIQAPLETYTGVTARVQFTHGWGLVYADAPDAAKTVSVLEHDFGYRVEAVDAAQLALFQRRMAGLKQPKEAGSLADKLSMPQVMR